MKDEFGFFPGECAGGRPVYGFVMIAILFFVFFLNAAKDGFVSALMYVVAVDTKLDFSVHQGSLLATGYYASYAVGRLVYSFLGLKIPVQVHNIMIPLCCF